MFYIYLINVTVKVQSVSFIFQDLLAQTNCFVPALEHANRTPAAFLLHICCTSFFYKIEFLQVFLLGENVELFKRRATHCLHVIINHQQQPFSHYCQYADTVALNESNIEQ